MLDRAFEQLQQAQIVRIKIEAVSLDSTMIKVHPDGTGALKNGPQAIGIFMAFVIFALVVDGLRWC